MFFLKCVVVLNKQIIPVVTFDLDTICSGLHKMGETTGGSKEQSCCAIRKKKVLTWVDAARCYVTRGCSRKTDLGLHHSLFCFTCYSYS